MCRADRCLRSCCRVHSVEVQRVDTDNQPIRHYFIVWCDEIKSVLCTTLLSDSHSCKWVIVTPWFHHFRMWNWWVICQRSVCCVLVFVVMTWYSPTVCLCTWVTVKYIVCLQRRCHGYDLVALCSSTKRVSVPMVQYFTELIMGYNLLFHSSAAFSTRDAMVSAIFVVVRCLSVCQTRWCIVSRRLKTGFGLPPGSPGFNPRWKIRDPGWKVPPKVQPGSPYDPGWT